MILVTVEVLPGGNAARRYSVASVSIANDGTGTAETGNYDCRVIDQRLGSSTVATRCRVERFPRQEKTALDLLYLALCDVLGKRNEPAPAEEPRQVVEPAPATVRWRCEGCKRSVPGYRVRGGPPTEHWHWNEGDSMAMYTCGPCVPVTDAQPAGAAP